MTLWGMSVMRIQVSIEVLMDMMVAWMKLLMSSVVSLLSK